MAKQHEIETQIDDRLNDEIGTIYKTAPYRVCLLYPSPYRIGMSSLGFQSLYRALNASDSIVCERAFLPDDTDHFRAARKPLFTYESKTYVSEVDIIGVSLSYELEVLGLIETLELAGIPCRATDRSKRSWPLILIGGPITFANPLPIAPFADIMILGEADELIHIVCAMWFEAKDRASFYEKAATLPGVYIPHIHGEKLVPIAQSRDDLLPAYSVITTPNTELSNMHLVENARGCHRGCTFCVMRRTTNGGMRTFDPERVLSTIPDHAKRVGLVGAATMDHPKIKEIVRSIVDSGREIGLSSLRADRLDDEFVEMLAKGGVRTLTVASDGASERMRKIAKKHIKEKHLRHAAELVARHGLKQLKLYMVFGYPEETEDDIHEMVEFVGELSTICKVALGMSPLVAKKRTPLDGEPFEDKKSLEKKIRIVHQGLGKSVDIRSTSVRWAWVEYQISQGGWDMADVAEAVYADGGGFAAWKRAIKKHKKTVVNITRPIDDRIRPGALMKDFDLADLLG